MQGGTGLLDIIMIIVVLAFVVTRFMSHELPKDNKKAKSKQRTTKKNTVVPFPEEFPKSKKKAKATQAAPQNLDDLSGMEQIKATDASFNEKEFIEGAEGAYTMFYEALNNVDEETLDDLTAPRLFDRYMEKVESLEDEGQRQVFNIKDIKSAEIVDAKLHGQTAIIDVKYKAIHIEYIVNGDDDIVKGDDSTQKEVDVIWTWARNINAADPNWELEDIAKLA